MDQQPEPAMPDLTTDNTSNAPAWAARPLLLALGLFAAALVVILILVARAGSSGDTLDARLLTLELAYPAGQPVVASIEGQPGAAPGGTTITCRAADGNLRLGRATASDDGSFNVQLDPSPWPLETLTGDGAKTLNDRVECRSGSGDWVSPLRQPRVRIN